jgi:type I restriction enzyme S subunit
MREGWVETTLGDVAEYVNGYPFKPEELGDEGLPVIRIKQLLDPNEPVDRSAVSAPDRCRLTNGDIVFSWSGTLAVRKWDRGTALLNQHLFRVIEKPGVNREWLAIALDYALTELGEKSHGTTMKHITKQTLLPHKVSLPPSAEQRRIVDVIESVDNYITALETRAETARTARSALLHDLLSRGSQHWPSHQFGDLLEVERGSSPRPIGDFLTDAPDGTNWIKIGDASASTKYIYSTEKKIKLDGFSTPRFVKSGDFILSNSMSYGRPYIMRTDGCIHDGWMLLTEVVRNFDEDFLYNLLQSNEIQEKFTSLAAGSGVRNLKIDSVKAIEVNVPPMDVQAQVAQHMNAFDALSLTTNICMTEARNLRTALLSDLLSGNHEIPASYDQLLGAA